MPIFCFEMAAFINEDPNCRCGEAHFGRKWQNRRMFFFQNRQEDSTISDSPDGEAIVIIL